MKQLPCRKWEWRPAIIAVLMGLFSFPAVAQTASYVPGEILVKFKPDTSEEMIKRLDARMKTTVKQRLDFIGVRSLSLPPGLSVEEAVVAYQEDPDVLYAEPNYIRRAFFTPNDPGFGEQWGLHNAGQIINDPLGAFNGSPDADIDAPEAWDITTGSAGLIIAVIDSGIDLGHPDLNANIWNNPNEAPGDQNGDSCPGLCGVDDDGDGLVDEDSSGLEPGDAGYLNDMDDDDDENGYIDDIQGWDFVGTQTYDLSCVLLTDDPVGDNAPTDDNGHGSHVSGIAAAVGDNGIGISGIVWNAEIMPLKILDANGCGSVGDEIQAIQYAVDKGARIINASFGGSGGSNAERDAIAMADAAGVVFVAAAGNLSSDNDSFPIYPAGYDLPNVISVAASDPYDQLPLFSNYGRTSVDLAAPGVSILSTVPTGGCPPFPIGACDPTGYRYLDGTSMAAPHVSGAAGLLLSNEPSLIPEEVRAWLLLTSDRNSQFRKRMVSSGRLNASRALRHLWSSDLSGGGGGCGFPLGLGRPNPPGSGPPVQALLFLLALSWPILMGSIRWVRMRIGLMTPGRSRAGILGLMLLAAALGAMVVSWPGEVSAQVRFIPELETPHEKIPFTPRHSIGLKLGYHQYVGSDYLETNRVFISQNDLSGMSGELEYDWRLSERYSLSVTAGRYRSRTDLKAICCIRTEFSTTYLLFTPKYYSGAGPVETYIGGGLGYYYFDREIHGLIQDRLTAPRIVGVHGVLGMGWSFHSRVSALAEIRYALARVRSANDSGDSLDVGGLNYSLGLRWFFSGTSSK